MQPQGNYPQVVIVTCHVRYYWIPEVRFPGQMPPPYAGMAVQPRLPGARPLPYTAQRSAGAWAPTPQYLPDALDDAYAPDAVANYSPPQLPAPDSAEFGAEGAHLIGGQNVEHRE
jgi:hypothetical protein